MVPDDRQMTDGDRGIADRGLRIADFPVDVDVAIVSHNNLEALPDTLTALFAAGCPPAQITVVDVASTDGTAEWLTREHRRVRMRRLDRNAGPNPGRNVGITEATRPFALLMDADVRVRPDTVQKLRAAMRADTTVKIGSPIVVDEAQPDRIQYAGGAVHFMCEAVNPWANRTLAERGASPQDIGAAPACALLLDRQAAVEIGLFDERYFMGKDDGDFIHRMKIAGYKVWELPDAIVLHNARQRSDWIFYYQIRNRWHFILKNYQLRTILGILPALAVHEPLQLAVLTAKGYLWTYVQAIGGVLKLLPSLPRDRALTRRIRRKADRDLLTSAPLVVRDDLASSAVMRRGKASYDRFLDGYWRLLKRTVLAR
jgi:GT2 family glycosyltransferase